MDDLIAVFTGNYRSGLYRLVTPISKDELLTLSQTHNAGFFTIDGRNITSKAAFLQAMASAMSFPAYFGQNWDALEDCLTDLEWLTSDRVILLYEQPEVFAQNGPAEWEVALDVLRSTVDYWHDSDRPFYVLFKGDHTDLVGLEAI